MSETEVITYEEYKKRQDGGFYVLYWVETDRYYGGSSKKFSGRHHKYDVDRCGTYLFRHWKKHGPPDIVIVVSLEEGRFEFEQAWLDIFQDGPLYDRSTCLNTTKYARGGWDLTPAQRKRALDNSFGKLTLEQYRELGRVSGKKNYLAGIGIAGLTRAQRKEAYEKSLKNGFGNMNLTSKQLSAAGKKGYKNGLGKLTSEDHREIGLKVRKLDRVQIHEIRHLLALGDMTHEKIAEHFPVKHSTISNINRGVFYADW